LAAMGDPFVSLIEWMHPSASSETPESNNLAETVPDIVEPEPQGAADAPIAELAAQVRRFRAALDDALEIAVAALLVDIASEVVGRELRLGPVDIAAIVTRARERYAMEEPLRVRLHPDECDSVQLDATVIGDASLRRGDVVIEVRAGPIDARLGTRLQRVLDQTGS
jgi:flagellar biosynthesis/type III secretory pathway protein FliH